MIAFLGPEEMAVRLVRKGGLELEEEIAGFVS